MKKALFCELPEKVVSDTKIIARKLNIPVVKVVELALKEFKDNGPQLELSFKNDNTRKPRKL
jgi:phosphohistidine swiveling domain-containing protein